MKIIVIGTGFVAQGYLRVLHYFGYHPLVISRAWLNYYDPNEVDFLLFSYKPDLVINCAGYTGNTVDDCEQNKDECWRANAELPKMLATLCSKRSVPLIHISTACMLDNNGTTTRFTEANWPDFLLGYYQQSKLAGERAVYDASERSWIFRIRMPFSQFPHPRNWLLKLCKYDRILDGRNSVTWLDEFCMRSVQLQQKASPGIYLHTQPGVIHTIEVAEQLHRAGLRGPVAAYDPAQFLADGHVKRSEAMIDASKFEKAYGTVGTPAQSAIDYCIDHLKLTMEQKSLSRRTIAPPLSSDSRSASSP